MLYQLKTLRKLSGLSQIEMAEKLNVALGTFRNWEQCLNMPQDVQTLKKWPTFST